MPTSRLFRKRHRRGYALLLVLILMAVATVMAYALLGNAATQAAATAGQASASQAEALAESGIELAMYYLQHPGYAPSLVAATSTAPAYWSGGTNLRFTGMSGTVTVKVTPSGTTGTLWTLSATGSSSLNGVTNTKTLSATAQVNGTYQIGQGLISDTALTIPSNLNINGGVECTQAVSVNVLAHVAGGISAPSASGPYSGGLSSPPLSNPVPDFNSIRQYTTYTYGGISYPSAAVNPSANNNVSGGNPAGIFKYTSGTVALVGPMTIHGTLWVPNGGVTFRGSVTVTPASGYPAIVTSGSISSAFVGAHLTANGTVYAGGGIAAGDLLSSITITGSLQLPTSGLFSSFLGSIAVTYNAAKASVPDLTSNGAYLVPSSVKLTAWNP